MRKSGHRRERRAKIIHASKFEDNVIKDLEKRGVKFEYEPTTFQYSRPGRGYKCSSCGGKDCSVVRRYTPDLRVGDVYIELKGKFTSENRSKMEDFLKGDPGIDLRFIFMRDNWITAKHKSKYSDWAKKLGVKYHIGTKVPDDWITNQGTEVPEEWVSI